ncbi:MAG: LAGLIDADG family homing endonuclease [Minisyncoccia bacterium]
MPIFKDVNKDFFKKWTPNMSYVLGFFAADGYITLNKRNANFWCIQIKDNKLLQEIRKAVGSNHKISERFNNKYKTTLYRLQIGSKEMCDDLRKLGFYEGKTKNLSVPNVPSKYFKDFIRGYFDGDGNVWSGLVHKERAKPLLTIRCVFTSCSKQFLLDIHERLLCFGVSGGVLSKGQGNYYRLTYSAKSTLIFYDFVYNGIVKDSSGLHLERKKRIFDKYRMQL